MKYCILYNHLPVSPAYLLYVLETSTQVKKKRNCESNRDEDAKTTRCNVSHGEMINYDLHDVAIQTCQNPILMIFYDTYQNINFGF